MTGDCLAPAVLADDLHTLADQVPFDDATTAVLEQAADVLDQIATPRALTTDEFMHAIDLCRRACAAMEDGPTVAGHFLGKLARLLLRPSTALVPVAALHAIAQGEPLAEVAVDYGVPTSVVREVAPLLGRDKS